MAVMMSVIVGMSVIHGWMLYYNITEVHAWAWSRAGVLATLIARVLRGFALKGGRRRPSREGAGKTGCALHPRSRVQGVERDAHEHTGSAEAVRPSLRNGFNGFLRALPGDRPSCHRHPRDAKHHRELDASIGASGPHDFAVRDSTTLVSRGDRVHRIPPHVRDDREPPLLPGGMAYGRRDLGQNNSRIFSLRILYPALV